MNRKLVWLAPIVALMIVLLPTLGLLLSRPAAAQGGADLYIKDTPLDTGSEPNPDTGPMWVSEDIWVRNAPDPGYQPNPFPETSPSWTPLPHQNPEYRDSKYSQPNYVYVRVRNRGAAASTGAERLRLYWAKASTGLAWPTQWIDYLASTCGPTDLYGAEITKPRVNAATASAAERNAYRDAILAIGTLPSFVFPGGVRYWHKQDEVHEFGPSNRHGTPAFLPWHREMINRYEVLLQEHDPTVKLLYWDWTTNPTSSTGGFNFFTSSFMGASGAGTGGVSIGAPFIPALGAPPVSRNLGGNPCCTTQTSVSDATVLSRSPYSMFHPFIESSPHDYSHVYIGGGTNMSAISTAAEDPFFFLLHANVDRLWAQWQRNPASLSRLNLATTYNPLSSNINVTTNMAPWNGGGGIRPWTVADGYIVNKTAKDASVVSPPIYDTAPLVIPVLQPGEAVVIEIPWYPPNPADFGCFGGDQGHFCLLGRIETAITPPFGMTTAEGPGVFANTKNNNNIAWKNITVVDNFAGALGLTSVLVRNVFREPIAAGLRFANTREIGTSFFNFGRISVDLKPELFRRWREGGGVGQGIEPQGNTGRISVQSPEAFIQNMRLEPGEVFSVDILFELAGDYPLPLGVLPKWDLMQTGTPEDPRAVVGGQRFHLDFRKLALVEASGDWRYLDNGSFPGADWIVLDFDDSRWKQGRAELGFGNDPVTTIDGGPPNRRHITTYFRRAFEVADPAFYRNLLLRLKRDDGAVVYLNGQEVYRVNLPEGAITADTLATREVSGLEEEVFFPIDATDWLQLLKQGRNVIAVEVHQDAPSSPDLSFDLELVANPAITRFPPQLRFVSLENGAQFQMGQSIPIEVETFDVDGQVRSVLFLADGELLSTDADPPFAFQWQDARLGSHRLRAVVTDDEQMQTTVDVTVTVLDNTPPIVDLLVPADGAMFQAHEPIQVVAQAADPGGAVARVEFYLRDADLFGAPNHMVGSADASPYTVELTGVAPGHYMLTAVARDDHDMTSPSLPVHIMVHDTSGPRLFLPHIAVAAEH